MENIRLIACDLDNTLLDSKGELPPDIWDYVGRLTEAGITFVPATGRPMTRLSQMFNNPDHPLTLISDNGGITMQGGETTNNSLLEPADYRRMLAAALDNTTGIPVLCAAEHAYVPAIGKEHEESLGMFMANIVFTDDLDDVGEDVAKFSVYFPGGDSRAAKDAVFDPQFSEDFEVTLGGHPWVDIMAPGISKGAALTALAKQMGLERENLMAFGDAPNDLAMLQTVGRSYAVANADPEVKAVATHAAPSNDDRGVLRVLDEVLAGRSKTTANTPATGKGAPKSSA